ncbi:unnamed protein product [marine sediment metagenome]|uniref:Uncharacterized protein n=1 Tax=marine sediment metagenome TaxID=412755 RepID=X1TNR2_9ZZZZ
MGATRMIDLALINGKVITVNAKNELAEAVAVRDGKIIAVGKTDEVREMTGSDTEVIDLQGKTVTPGFIESHCHPSMAGPALVFEVDVRTAGTIDDIINMLRQRF